MINRFEPCELELLNVNSGETKIVRGRVGILQADPYFFNSDCYEFERKVFYSYPDRMLSVDTGMDFETYTILENEILDAIDQPKEYRLQKGSEIFTIVRINDIIMSNFNQQEPNIDEWTTLIN